MLFRNRFVSLVVALFVAVPTFAAVKVEKLTRSEMPGLGGGMLGAMMGKKMQEGVRDIVAVNGNRMMQGDTLIDLDADVIHEINHKKKTYRTTPLEEYAQRLQSASQFLGGGGGGGGGRPAEGPRKEMEVSVDVKKGGANVTKNGHSCEPVVTTMTIHEKGKTLEQGGGMKVISDQCIGELVPEMAEINEFMQRYLKRIGLADLNMGVAAMIKSNPMMQQATEEMQKLAMKGTSYATKTEFFMVQDPNAPQGQQGAQGGGGQPQSIGSALGGAFGGFGRKKRNQEQQQPQGQGQGGQAMSGGADKPSMISYEDLLSVTTNLSPQDTSIDPSYKQKK